MKKFQYGGTNLFQSQCPNCKEKSLSGSLVFKCDICNNTWEEAGRVSSITVVCGEKRLQLPVKIKKEILEKQGHLCFWCGIDLKTSAMKIRCGIPRTVKVHFDHKKCYSSLGHNGGKDNFVATCDRCNLWKSSLYSDSDDIIRAFLIDRWVKEIKSQNINILDEDIPEKVRQILSSALP